MEKSVWGIFGCRAAGLKGALAIIGCIWLYSPAFSQHLDDFVYTGSFEPQKNIVTTYFQFNGYTDHWHDMYSKRISYGSLFKASIPDIERTIAQSRRDAAEDMGIPGLTMQEGFLNGLLTGPYISMEEPTIQELEQPLQKGNLLVYVSPNSETGRILVGKLSKNALESRLKSHQYDSGDFAEVNAFILDKGDRHLFVVSSEDQESLDRVKSLLDQTEDVLEKYDLHRGWFGVQTMYNKVTCTPGHPLEVIGRGMNEGNDWFVFDGDLDFLAKDELEQWVNRVKLPVVTDVGHSPIYGCQDYDELQIQSIFDNEVYNSFAREKEGYIFRTVYSPTADKENFHYDGYFATEGDKEQIDKGNVPFLFSTGEIYSGAVPSMVLFVEKGKTLSKERLWDAVLSRREVAVFNNAGMMGPALYRNVLQMLYLDRIFLENYFGSRVSIEAVVTDDYQLHVNITNTCPHEVSGALSLTLPAELKATGTENAAPVIPAGSTKTLSFKLKAEPDAMGKANPIAVHFDWGNSGKSTVALLNLPLAISVHQLLYGHAPKISYPVTIHNFTDKTSFPVKVEVLSGDQAPKVVYKTEQVCFTGKGTFKDLLFELKVPPGNYQVKVSALNIDCLSQLGVGAASGKSILYETDLNADGVNEYRMENDSVQVTLLTTGARVIEYMVKSGKDNLLFKLWPEKPDDDKRPFRKRYYYPYGGFEDFLGQPGIETDHLYHAQMVKQEGDYVQVEMTADFYGNKLEKTFTLYGNSPLLEIRWALTFKNPEMDVLGPQPILELGDRHGTEDVFIIPEKDSLRQYRMMPERYYGRLLYPTEGWNAGHDTRQNLSFIGAFPVNQPLFLHMWQNHPSNRDANYYYAEFQPWVPIFKKSTMYFSYYIWGNKGAWQNGLNELRKRNLITKQTP